MRLKRTLASAVLAGALFGAASPAHADITGFLGLAGGPSVRDAKGVAVGIGLVMFGMEVEYSETGERVSDLAPRIRTGMVNGLLQTPLTVAGVQVYVTAGAGLYNHELESRSETNFGINIGGGVKKTLVGPVRVRVDYRLFRFMGSPIGSDVVHRVYAGVNLSF